jgi:type VII secretion integral membrane protein EccD
VADQHCRVTVVGDSRRVNLVIPARAPIAEYAPTLAELCQQDDEAAFPVVWSLAVAGRAPFPLAASLDQAGVTDGQVLYLRDVAAGEADEPVVLGLDEAVSDAAERLGWWAWTSRSRALTGMAIGILWLVAALVATAFDSAGTSPKELSGLAIATGLLSAVLAAVASRRRWPVPGPLGRALAVSAVPEFAVAGGFLVPGHGSAVAFAAGAVAGALAALIAIPETVTAALAILACVGLAVSGGLSALHADAMECASVIAVIVLALASLGPQAIGRLVAYSPFETAVGAADADAVSDHVRRARMLFALWSTLLGLVAAADLVWLATFPNWYAQALAGSGSLAMLLGAGVYRQLTEVVANAAAGASGLLALVLEVPPRVHSGAWAGPLAATVIGCGVLVAGMAQSFTAHDSVRPPRGQVLVATLFRALSVPLALGVFGLFSHLQSLGHQL